MELTQLMERDAVGIVDEAAGALDRSHLLHYREQTPDERRARMQALFDVVRRAIDERDLSGVLQHSRSVAQQRFEAGFDVAEVQAAFNVLEEIMWRRVVAAVPPDGLAQAIGLLATVLGSGRDELARAWIGLATKRHAPSLDLRALFEGTQPRS